METLKSKINLTESSHHTLGILAIVTAVLIAASISTATKQALAHFSPSVVFAIRFAIAAIIFVPFVREFNINLTRDSTILGLLLFGKMACQTIGLETISANRASFFFGLSVVFVTLFEVVFHKRMPVRAILASGLAFSGIAIMSWEGREPLSSSLWLMASVLFEAAGLIMLERFARHHPTLPLTAMRVWVIAILGLLWAAPEIIGQLQVVPERWGVLLYLGIVATVILFLLSTIAMRWVPAYEAALFGTLEPVFGAVIAFFLLGETFSKSGFIGAVMVLSGMILGTSRPTVDHDSLKLSTDRDSES